MLAAFAALSLLCSVPLLLPRVPPLSDYPNHLARIHLLAHLGELPALQPFYATAWAPLPNLAFDLVGTGLAKLMPTVAAGTVVVVGTVLLLGSGVLALSAALHRGRPQPLALAGFLFVFSQSFYLGFVGSVIGTGLCLWAVASWLVLADRPAPQRAAVCVAVGLVLFFAHLFSLAVFGIVVGFVELHRLRRARFVATALVVAAPFVVPAAIFLATAATPVGGAATYWVREWDDVLPILVSPVRNISVKLDVGTMAVVLALLAAGFATRRLRLVPELRLALPFLAGLSLVMPEMLASSYYAHLRLPTYALLLLCAGLEWRGGVRPLVLAGAALLALLGLRTALLTQQFVERGAFIDRLRAAFADAPPGLRVASISLRRPGDGVEPGWDHGICLLVIDRAAYVANVFMVPGQQPLRAGPAATGRTLPRTFRATAPVAIEPGMFDGLDRVVVVNPGAPHPAWPPALELLGHHDGFDVYRVRPPT